MKKIDYLNQIQTATTARELHDVWGSSATDAELSPGDFSRISEACGKRFGQLNAAAVWPQLPRWNRKPETENAATLKPL